MENTFLFQIIIVFFRRPILPQVQLIYLFFVQPLWTSFPIFKSIISQLKKIINTFNKTFVCWFAKMWMFKVYPVRFLFFNFYIMCLYIWNTSFKYSLSIILCLSKYRVWNFIPLYRIPCERIQCLLGQEIQFFAIFMYL